MPFHFIVSSPSGARVKTSGSCRPLGLVAYWISQTIKMALRWSFTLPTQIPEKMFSSTVVRFAALELGVSFEL
jgi:hypothetical protein